MTKLFIESHEYCGVSVRHITDCMNRCLSNDNGYRKADSLWPSCYSREYMNLCLYNEIVYRKGKFVAWMDVNECATVNTM